MFWFDCKITIFFLKMARKRTFSHFFFEKKCVFVPKSFIWLPRSVYFSSVLTKHLGNLEYFGQKHLGNLEYLFIVTFPDFPLQIGLIVYHFRYNVGYQTYLVLLAKYLLHHAKSFSAFSVTFAIRFEKLLNFITGFINLITNCKAYEKVIYFDCCCIDGSWC